MFTVLISVVGPGIFELKPIVIPSCGWMRKVSTFGGVAAGSRSAKSRSGGRLKCREISVVRRESLFPVRRRKGTPAHRQESRDTRSAANVSREEPRVHPFLLPVGGGLRPVDDALSVLAAHRLRRHPRRR